MSKHNTPTTAETGAFGDKPVTLSNQITGEVLEITTANPTTFYQALSQPDHMRQAQIAGQLFKPNGVANPAVVIVVPGSLGVAPSHVAKAELLTSAGIAACVIDPFGARGVSSTVANQAQYSFAASAWDVLATTDLLSKRSDLDAKRIGAQGHSRGGSASIAAACMTRLVPNATEMCGVYAAYPWCGMQFLNPDVGGTQVRSIIGDQDEWCSPQQVQGQMHAMRLCGAEASVQIVQGAHHSFDRETGVEMIADASVAPAAPTIYMEDNGTCLHPLTGEANSEFTERELMLAGIKAGYGVKGAHIGTTGDAAEQFHIDMMQFWERVT